MPETETVTLTLTPEERKRAKEWAEKLHAKFQQNPERLRVWRADAATPDHWRVASEAELAAVRHFGLCDPVWVVQEKGGDRGIDTYTMYGRPVQIKYRSKPGGLMATNGLDFHAELAADYYILTWPGAAEGDFQIVGWCTRDEYLRRVFRRPPTSMYGKKFEMRLDELHPATEGLPDV